MGLFKIMFIYRTVLGRRISDMVAKGNPVMIGREVITGFYKEKKKVLLMSSITGGESNQK